MGGHGGLNILPQKRWNVYNFDNREKVRKDEENAAKDEQLKRQQSRQHDSSLRLQELRRVRGIDPGAPPPEVASSAVKSSSVSEVSVLAKTSLIVEEPKSDSKHINLFEGIKIFDPVVVDDKKRKRREEEENDRRKKMKIKKEEVRVVGPEDEVYRLGYRVAGKGVAAPWYTMKREVGEGEEVEEEDRDRKVVVKKKKTLEELREERLSREKTEKERQQALISKKGGGPERPDRYNRVRERRQWRH